MGKSGLSRHGLLNMASSHYFSGPYWSLWVYEVSLTTIMVFKRKPSVTSCIDAWVYHEA